MLVSFTLLSSAYAATYQSQICGEQVRLFSRLTATRAPDHSAEQCSFQVRKVSSRLCHSDLRMQGNADISLRLWKIVFPNGITDVHTPAISRRGSKSSLATQNSTEPSKNGHAPATMPNPITAPRKGGIFRGWSTLSATPRGSGTTTPVFIEDGPVEEFIVSGTAFGKRGSRGSSQRIHLSS